jgi:hypothetical protein
LRYDIAGLSGARRRGRRAVERKPYFACGPAENLERDTVDFASSWQIDWRTNKPTKVIKGIARGERLIIAE